MKKLLPIFLILSILAIVYGAKMYQYQDNPALNSEIENIYLELNQGIRVKVGSFTCPGTTGNYSVTGVGFKPRYVDFRVMRNETTVVYGGLGWMDYSGNQNTIIWSAKDDEQRGTWDVGSCVFLVDSIGATLIKAAYVSMDNDGFTINFSAVTEYKIMWKAVR